MYLVDSNVFLNVILHTEKYEISRKFLNKNTRNITTTLVNLMEIFTVLTRKYKWSKEEAIDIVETLKKECEILIPNEYDFIDAYEIQQQYLLTINDALIAAIAKRENLTLITFDKELLQYDGAITKIKTILEY